MQVLRICMPSTGDMQLIAQNGGTIDLEPIFFGKEAAGPHIQVLEGNMRDGKFEPKEAVARYKLKLKQDGKVELKRSEDG